MILSVENISFYYKKGDHIFKDVSFSLKKGDILSILGPNGTGKSTLLNCLSGLLDHRSGDIKLAGQSIKDMNFNDIAKKIGYVQQIHIPSYDHTVREYITMGRTPHLGLFQRPSRKDCALVDDAISLMSLENIADKSYMEISGGERQQASIARVIVQEPDIIMLDEPTAHLDYGNQINTLKIIKTLSQQGFTIINTTHNPDQVILLDNYVGILDKTNFNFGKSQDLMREDNLRKLYNTDIRIIHSQEVDRMICTVDKL